MKLAMLVNPFTERNLALAAQAGVEGVVLPYPGPGSEPLRAARSKVEAAGMRLTVLERKIPHRRLVHQLPGWEEEVFPNRRSVDDGGSAALEEERRLAYVGLTRARKRVWICHASSRRVYNQWLASAPSRFIDELPADQVEHVVEQGLYGGVAEPGIAAWEDPWANPRPGRGPGFQRMRGSGAAEGGRGASRSGPPKPAVSKTGLQPGVRIFHQKFGYGTVRTNEGGKLEIDFEKAGTKKVMESFVEPA